MNEFVIRIEDADYKRSIILNNIAWGTELNHIMLYLKNTFDVEFESEFPSNTMLTSRFLIMRLNSFDKTLRILEELPDWKFKVNIFSNNPTVPI